MLIDKCSLEDTALLRKMILENPDSPLLILCGESVSHYEIGYVWSEITDYSVESMTMYKDMWLDEDAYGYELWNDLRNKEEYADLSDEEYDKMIDKKVEETEFVKAIVIYVE